MIEWYTGQLQVNSLKYKIKVYCGLIFSSSAPVKFCECFFLPIALASRFRCNTRITHFHATFMQRAHFYKILQKSVKFYQTRGRILAKHQGKDYRGIIIETACDQDHFYPNYGSNCLYGGISSAPCLFVYLDI